MSKNSENQEEFDAYKDDYSELIGDSLSFAGQSHDFYTRVKADKLIEIIEKKHLSKEAVDVLDVGCGHGLIHPLMLKRKAGLNISGVDVASTVIEKAKETNPAVNYRAYDGKRLPFGDNSFDVVYTICVMHHVPPAEWLDFIKEMKRVTRPGGQVIVFEHNPFNPLTVRVVNSCPIDADAVLLKNQQVKSLMTQAGLQNCRHDYIIFIPVDHKLCRLMESGIRWLPLGAQYVTYSDK